MAAKKESEPGDELLSASLMLRVAPSDIERLEALAARFPVATRNAIGRTAMRIGITAIEDQPTILLGEPPKKLKR